MSISTNSSKHCLLYVNGLLSSNWESLLTNAVLWALARVMSLTSFVSMVCNYPLFPLIVTWVTHFPYLSILAKNYLTISAYSVPVESMFSTCGLMLNIKRSSMAAYHANILTVIHDNYNFPINRTAAILCSQLIQRGRWCLASTEVHRWMLCATDRREQKWDCASAKHTALMWKWRTDSSTYSWTWFKIFVTAM